VTLRPGDLAPDVALIDPSGDEVRLAAVLRGEATVTIFLRHLG